MSVISTFFVHTFEEFTKTQLFFRGKKPQLYCPSQLVEVTFWQVRFCPHQILSLSLIKVKDNKAVFCVNEPHPSGTDSEFKQSSQQCCRYSLVSVCCPRLVFPRRLPEDMPQQVRLQRSLNLRGRVCFPASVSVINPPACVDPDWSAVISISIFAVCPLQLRSGALTLIIVVSSQSKLPFGLTKWFQKFYCVILLFLTNLNW